MGTSAHVAIHGSQKPGSGVRWGTGCSLTVACGAWAAPGARCWPPGTNPQGYRGMTGDVDIKIQTCSECVWCV